MNTLDLFESVIKKTIKKLDQKAGNLNNDEVSMLSCLMDIFIKYNNESRVVKEEITQAEYIKARDKYDRNNTLPGFLNDTE